MEILTTSQARENLFKLVEFTATSHEPVYIVGKKHKCVLLAEEDFAAMQETLHLLSIPGMKESIIQSSKEPLENYSDTIDWDDEDDEE